MSKAEPGNEIQLETMASTMMDTRISQVRFRNPRSPKQRGAFVPPPAERHNPARTRDGAEYRSGREVGQTALAMTLRCSSCGSASRGACSGEPALRRAAWI